VLDGIVLADPHTSLCFALVEGVLRSPSECIAGRTECPDWRSPVLGPAGPKAWARMVCKFHASMQTPFILRSLTGPRRACALMLAAALAAPGIARAERADRLKPLNVEADQPGKIDLLNQFVVFNGNVVVTKGTMTIRAARIEVRETPDGYHGAIAFGAPNKPATLRQKRDGVDEFIEGEAERLEYDGKTDTVRFVGNASVRRLRGSGVADEIAGNLVTYDSIAEVFSVSGGAAATPANPGGRVRAVLTPREGSAAAAEAAAQAASQPLLPLRLSPSLGEKK
jgi:lipopolysaccharide export system protein LptA